jgi:hypothetical protein
MAARAGEEEEHMVAVKKVDLYKLHRSEYIAPRKPALVVTKPAKYLTVTGQGAPASAEFQEKIGAIYSVAFTIKMTKKFAGQDYKVCHLEGLWSGGEVSLSLKAGPPETWKWKLLIRVPEFIRPADVKVAIRALEERGKGASAAEVRLEKIDEGQCVQMLHVGPYATEEKTIAQMLSFTAEQGLAFHGLHHEIYLSDPRRVPPQRLRTILRHPVRRKP